MARMTIGHRSGEEETTMDKPCGDESAAESTPSTNQKLPPVHFNGLFVGIFFPNESTPYVVRFGGGQITLEQFKQLVPKKGNFRYFFQCVSDELGTEMVLREVVKDQEILPSCDNKVVAKIIVNQ